jgi:putative methyltransferase (TIGR04325 family)
MVPVLLVTPSKCGMKSLILLELSVNKKEILRQYLPPAILDWLLRMGAGGNKFKYGFESWEEAASLCSGYDNSRIVEVVTMASRKVRDEEAVYERDGVLFAEIQYSWPLLACLLATPRSHGPWNIVDWGGALGSSYRQNKQFLNSAGIDVNWYVVEQPTLVRVGQSEFSNEELSFHSQTPNNTPGFFDVVLFASSLNYISNTDHVINTVLKMEPSRIIFDRTPTARGVTDLYGVQTVGRDIYKASYPIRIFGNNKIAELLSPKYDLLASWKCDLQPDPKTVAHGYFFKLKE